MNVGHETQEPAVVEGRGAKRQSTRLVAIVSATRRARRLRRCLIESGGLGTAARGWRFLWPAWGWPVFIETNSLLLIT